MAKAAVTEQQKAKWAARDRTVQGQKLGAVGSTGTVGQDGVFVPDPPRQSIFESARREAPKRAER